jgi:hypothetical protein
MQLVEQTRYENASRVLFRFRRVQLSVLRWVIVTERQKHLTIINFSAKHFLNRILCTLYTDLRLLLRVRDAGCTGYILEFCFEDGQHVHPKR